MKNNAELFVTLDHLHSVPGFSATTGFCNKGARALCNRYGLSWSEIIRDGGIAASKLEATKDALALKVVAYAKQAQEKRRG